ncbi:hypothetical protein GCM10009837_67720 [Streptomyces durmitorensis]
MPPQERSATRSPGSNPHKPPQRLAAYSATRTAPTAHSPPNPTPCKARKTSRVPKLGAKPQATVNTAYTLTVHISARTRPTRSASTPASAPPTADISRVTVANRPVWPLSSPK